MVRLRRTLGDDLPEDMLFQFRYGSIKTGVWVENYKCLSSFNSDMVRLRQAFGTLRAKLETEFQFRYGSIKTV